MSSPKEHHFVPQYFFRNFSHHPERKLINLVVLKTGNVIFNSSIKSQGKARRLHVSDDLEKAISSIENDMAKCIRDVIDNEEHFSTLSNRPSFFQNLAGAVLLQSRRVASRGRRVNEATAPLAHELLSSGIMQSPDSPSSLKEALANGDVRLGYDYRYHILSAIGAALLAPLLFFDMSIALLVNATGKPFVFSDNPAILTNSLLWDRREIQGITGHVSRGLIATMPLCEHLTIMFYDGEAYQIPQNIEGTVYLNCASDIGMLNAFQAVAADDSLYFGRQESAEYAQALALAHREASSKKAYVMQKLASADGTPELVHQFEKVLPIRPEFSFLQSHRVASPDDFRLARNEYLVSEYEKLVSLTRGQESRDGSGLHAFASTIKDAYTATSEFRKRK